ncbi:MAG: hypothetical protein GY834_15620, partial [Bacteroidetes bacterium]|nr:hypothetical protein [Bacteroidota bacterium]
MFLPIIRGMMGKYNFLIILTFLSIASYSQNHESNNVLLAEQFVSEAKYDSAIYHYKLLVSKTESDQEWIDYIHYYLRLSDIYRITEQYANMDTCINKLENSTNFKIEEHRELYAELL